MPAETGWAEQRLRQLTELHGIEYLYHITHLDNLESIAKTGLKSHNQAHEENGPVDISDPDVNERRRRRDPIYGISLHDYVPLYFRALNPMLYRRKDQQRELAILCVDSSVMHIPEVIFTDGNAASDYTDFFHDMEDLAKLDWNCLGDAAEYWHDREGIRRRCAEVLVPRTLLWGTIRWIVVQCPDTRSVAENVTGHANVIVMPDCFFPES